MISHAVSRAFAVSALSVALVLTAQDSKPSRISVIQPQDLPPEAQAPGEGLLLRAADDGTYLLYVEQNKGADLAIFDVTDPGHLKLRSVEHLSASGPYIFVRPANQSAELVRFRNGGRLALLDLSKAAHPELHDASALKQSSQTAVVDNQNLETPAATKPTPVVAKAYKVVDDAPSSDTPRVISTVSGVEYETDNPDTGTTFLLGQGGLTIVRRMDKEVSFKEHKQQTSN